MADCPLRADDRYLRHPVRSAKQSDPVGDLRVYDHWSNARLTISYHAYRAEVFPTHIRARAVGFCYSFSRLSTAVTSILIGIILQYAGTPGVISFIVVSMLMVMLSVGIFGPRTRGIRLENI